MRTTLMLGIATLALSACQSADEKRAAETGQIEVTNGSAAEVSKLMKAAQPKLAMKPGEWRFQLAVLGAETEAGPLAEGDPKLATLKQQERTVAGCREAKDLKPIDLDQLQKAAGECSFPRYSLTGGKLDAEIECKQPNGATMRMAAKGTTGPDAFAVTLDQRSGTPGQAGYLALKLRATGTRLGECRG
jgi:hypothetical protein